MLTEHDSTGAVVGVKQGDLEVIAGLKLQESRGVQGYWFLESVSGAQRKSDVCRLTRRFLRWRYL
jgi:hypothetical protein